MSWDDVTLLILASFGCLTLLLTQVGEVLSKLPQIIRAWQEVQRVLRSGPDLPSAEPAALDSGDQGGDPSPE
ncbi:hypothetical protein [Streptomyces morookaense]|uniref:Uncharacterized protein n=1 Tax=Streptomyces morookaense TaxID=1970 RepID=A0A7Y7B3Q6_STRMO|nr:hypothetical protein [Streptomyces morookaense]NVK78473.1 hypothetical protein [Streptomyces morookaense]GHF32630.1 hypothetical protein GCM10010359_39160 [Streptomyces morookaense]